MIRLANKEESQEVIDFLVRVNGERNDTLARQYVECCFSNDYRKPIFVLYELEGRIIGSAAFSQELFTTGTWGVSWVCVEEQYRSHGYGEEIVKFCLDEIKQRIDGESFVILGTYPNKTGLYDKIGFKEVHNDSDHGSFMMKKIKPLSPIIKEKHE